jgi:hypothetical protein
VAWVSPIAVAAAPVVSASKADLALLAWMLADEAGRGKTGWRR